MAAEYSYPSKYTAAPTKSGKVLKVLIFFAIFCLAGELIWLLGIGPFRPFSQVNVIGAEDISREEILITAGFTADLSYVSADVREMEEALMEIVALESARVIKYYPGRLQIIVQKRQPVASAFVVMNGSTVPVLFDSKGVIYRIGGEKRDEFLSSVLPVISGLEIRDPYLGMKLPDLYIPLLEEIEKVKDSAPNLLKIVSEIEINRKAFDNFDLILYPIHKKIRVRLSEFNEYMLQYALLIIEVLSSEESGIEVFDFRSGIASYYPKGGAL